MAGPGVVVGRWTPGWGRPAVECPPLRVGPGQSRFPGVAQPLRGPEGGIPAHPAVAGVENTCGAVRDLGWLARQTELGKLLLFLLSEGSLVLPSSGSHFAVLRTHGPENTVTVNMLTQLTFMKDKYPSTR